MYDLIIGLEMWSNWKAILNFHDKTVTIDHVKLPIYSLQNMCSPEILDNLYQEATEPTISRIATNWVTQILDTKYEMADMPKIVKYHCIHLNMLQRNELLPLTIQHEE